MHNIHQKIEEEFNLDTPPEINNTIINFEELNEQSQELTRELNNSEKIDQALTEITDLDVHDTEMDDIADKAVKLHEDLIHLALATPPSMHSAKIFEVASGLLHTALQAKNYKIERKLKMLALQIKKVKVDSEIDPNSNNTGNGLDRNELLNIIKNRALNSPVVEKIEDKKD